MFQVSLGAADREETCAREGFGVRKHLDGIAAGAHPDEQVSSGLQGSKPGADPSLFCKSCHHHIWWGPGTFCKAGALAESSTIANTPGVGLELGLVAKLQEP